MNDEERDRVNAWHVEERKLRRRTVKTIARTGKAVVNLVRDGHDVTNVDGVTLAVAYALLKGEPVDTDARRLQLIDAAFAFIAGGCESPEEYGFTLPPSETVH